MKYQWIHAKNSQNQKDVIKSMQFSIRIKAIAANSFESQIGRSLSSRSCRQIVILLSPKNVKLSSHENNLVYSMLNAGDLLVKFH